MSILSDRNMAGEIRKLFYILPVWRASASTPRRTGNRSITRSPAAFAQARRPFSRHRRGRIEEGQRREK
jgi:hypothetical protein